MLNRLQMPKLNRLKVSLNFNFYCEQKKTSQIFLKDPLFILFSRLTDSLITHHRSISQFVFWVGSGSRVLGEKDKLGRCVCVCVFGACRDSLL